MKKKQNTKNPIRYAIYIFLGLTICLIIFSIFLFFRTKTNFLYNIVSSDIGNPNEIINHFNGLINNIFLLNLLITSLLAIIISFLYSLIRSYAKSKLTDLKEAAFFDPLTSLLNRKSFLNTLFLEVKRASRNNYAISLVLGNIDDFSAVNTKYGDDIGDIVLKDISAIIKTTLRRHDQVCRWKLDDFMIMLPETSIQGARTTAEKIRKKISDHTIMIKGNSIKVTMSFGTSVIEVNSNNFNESLEKAEEQLEAAKNDGKNTVK